MDDFMETLIEALDTDADVFESDRQISSDPWFGNPMDIFNDIYGNPGFGFPGPMKRMRPYGKVGYMGYGMGGYGGFAKGGYGGFAEDGHGGNAKDGYGGFAKDGYGGYAKGGYGGYGMGGYGGYGMGGFGKGFWSPYGFSNYGPQPQGYGQQPPTNEQDWLRCRSLRRERRGVAPGSSG